MFLEVVKYLVLALLLVTVLRYFKRSPQRTQAYTMMRGLRPRHFLVALPILVAVSTVFAVLYTYIPLTRWGWWSAIGGHGSIASGDTGGTSTFAFIIAVVVPMVVLAAVPMLALREERAFRLGSESLSVPRRCVQALWFGLLHLTMGIPVAAALAVSVAGLAFTWVYIVAFNREFTAGVARRLDGPSTELVMVETVVDGQSLFTQAPPRRQLSPSSKADLDAVFEPAQLAGVTEATLVHVAHNVVAITLGLAAVLFL